MPKKGNNTLRTGQPTMAVPAHMKSHVTRASSSSVLRKPSSAFHKLGEKDEDDMEVDEDEAGGEDEGEDDNVVEMITMLQEIQKRKATKTSARSATFQRDKAALFADSRKRADSAVQKGLASIEKARGTVTELKAKEISQESMFVNLRGLLESQEEYVHGVLEHLTEVIENLSHRRAAQINEASSMLELQATAREKSQKRLWALASTRISENMENQKIAADATALIKHYKVLLLS